VQNVKGTHESEGATEPGRDGPRPVSPSRLAWPIPVSVRPPPFLEPEEDGALKSWRRRHSQRERVIRPRDRPEAREEEEDRHHIRNEELSIVYHL
jgi:hypothetical protein